MKYEEKKSLLLALLMIIFLSGASFWHFRSLSLSSSKKHFVYSLENFTFPSIENILSEENLKGEKKDDLSDLFAEKNYKRQYIEDKIFFDYPSSWQLIELEEETIKNAKILFFAYPLSSIPASITLLNIKTSTIEELENFIKKESPGEIIEIETEEKEKGVYRLKIKYFAEKIDIISHQVGLLLDNEFYLLSFSSPAKDDLRVEEMRNRILSSVQIIN